LIGSHISIAQLRFISNIEYQDKAPDGLEKQIKDALTHLNLDTLVDLNFLKDKYSIYDQDAKAVYEVFGRLRPQSQDKFDINKIHYLINVNPDPYDSEIELSLYQREIAVGEQWPFESSKSHYTVFTIPDKSLSSCTLHDEIRQAILKIDSQMAANPDKVSMAISEIVNNNSSFFDRQIRYYELPYDTMITTRVNQRFKVPINWSNGLNCENNLDIVLMNDSDQSTTTFASIEALESSTSNLDPGSYSIKVSSDIDDQSPSSLRLKVYPKISQAVHSHYHIVRHDPALFRNLFKSSHFTENYNLAKEIEDNLNDINLGFFNEQSKEVYINSIKVKELNKFQLWQNDTLESLSINYKIDDVIFSTHNVKIKNSHHVLLGVSNTIETGQGSTAYKMGLVINVLPYVRLKYNFPYLSSLHDYSFDRYTIREQGWNNIQLDGVIPIKAHLQLRPHVKMVHLLKKDLLALDSDNNVGAYTYYLGFGIDYNIFLSKGFPTFTTFINCDIPFIDRGHLDLIEYGLNFSFGISILSPWRKSYKEYN